jgi:hypothetical protein
MHYSKLYELRGRFQTRHLPGPPARFASGRAEVTRSFSRNIGSPSQCFVKKKQKVPRCRRRIRLSSDETSGLKVHRVTPVNYTSYAVPRCRRRIGASSDQTPGLYAHRVTPVTYRSYAVRTVPVFLSDLHAGFASGRAEDSRSFSQKNSHCEFFCEKDQKSTMLPQAHLASTWPNVRFACSPRNSCYLHDLRGCSPERKFRLRQGGRFHSFSQKFCTKCKIFVKKIKKYHAAAGDSAVHRVKRPV